MSAQYDPKTGASHNTDETDEQRHAREHREDAKVGQPQESGAQPDAEAPETRDPEGEKRTSYVSREDADA